MERRLLAGHSPFEAIVGLLARRRRRAPRPRRRHGADPRRRATRPTARTSRRGSAWRSSARCSSARARRSPTSCARGSTSPTATTGRRSRARTARSSPTSAPPRPPSSPRCSTRAGVSRSRPTPFSQARLVKQIYPQSITGKGAVHGGSVLDHTFGKSDPYTLGVEEEYMLLDGETFDLVQHIETVLVGDLRPRARGADQRRADAVGARDRDAGVPHARRRDGASCRSCAAT